MPFPSGQSIRLRSARPYSCRFAGAARICYFSIVLMTLAIIQSISGRQLGYYVLFLWFIPLISSFPFFMLLRDVYQHSNTDSGRLTNSRVFFTDPFTRWAVFVYGQDMHIPHHLFPAIPHYRLGELHEILKQASADYGAHVVECHGTFHDALGRVTILDEMTRQHLVQTAENPPDFASCSTDMTTVDRGRKFSRIVFPRSPACLSVPSDPSMRFA